MIYLSIIIPSFCRPQLLKWGLFSLTKQIIPIPYEIVVINDGVEEDDTKQVCDYYSNKLNIKYVFTGERNLNGLRWRSPAITINRGVKEAKGNIIILSSPEIYLLNNTVWEMVIPILANEKNITMTKGYDDIKGDILKHIEIQKGRISKKYVNNQLSSLDNLETKYPFFMGMSKKMFLEIKGYDERFAEGFCFDDNDFVHRLLANKTQYYKLNNHKIIHLYHSRKQREGIPNEIKMDLWRKNQTLFHQNKKKEPTSKFIYNKSDGWKLQKIPKIANFYWGNEKLPYLRYLSILSFKKFNPSWKIRLYCPVKKYTQELLDSVGIPFVFEGRDYYSNLRNLGIEIIEHKLEFVDKNIEKYTYKYKSRIEVYKSDFLRWYLLSTEGGLWSDMDILYFRPIDKMNINQESNKDTNTVISLHPQYGHSVGFMLSSPNNTYYSHIFKTAIKSFDPSQYQSIGVDILNPEFPNITTIEKKFNNLKVKDIDIKTVYAYDALDIPSIFKNVNISKFNKNSIGLHWYAGHYMAREYVQKVTHLNYDKYNNVLIETIKRMYHD